MKLSQLKELAFAVLHDILRRLLAQFPDNMYINLMSMSVLTQKLNLKWQAIYLAELVEKKRADFSIMVATYGLIKTVEHDLLEEEIRDGQNTGINAVKVVELYSTINKMNDFISQSAQNVIDFWKELLEESTNGKKLESLGTKVEQIHSEVKEAFELVMKENQNHLYALACYGEYLTCIVNEQEEADKIRQKVRTISGGNQNYSRASADSGKLAAKAAFQTNPCIIICSADNSTMGVLKRINSECSKLLAWSEEELSGKHINHIMPKVFSDHHNW